MPDSQVNISRKIHLPLKVPYIEFFFEVSVWLKFDFENNDIESVKHPDTSNSMKV